MIAVHVVQSLFRPHLRETFAAEPAAGETVRDVVVRHLDPAWGEDPDVAVILNGRKLPTDVELDNQVEDGTDLVVLPEVGWEAVLAYAIQAIITAIIAAGINYAITRLLGRPKRAQLRGDEESPTYTWDGIATNYGPGGRIPIVYGSHRAGGQVIASNVYELGIGDEILVLQIALSEGPIAAVGGYDLTTKPEANGLGGLRNAFWRFADAPNGIRANGSNISMADAWVHLRAGTNSQSPVPGAIRGTTVYPVNKPLHFNQSQFHTTAPDVASARVRVRFDACFRQSGNSATPYTVDFSYALRSPSLVVLLPVPVSVTANSRSPFHYSFSIPMPKVEQWTIEFYRRTPDDGADTVSTCTWSEAVEEVTSGSDFAFPNVAMMTLELRAPEQMQGSPTITVPIWGRLVRWKHGGVWQAAAFWHPATGKYPGRNPAWIAYDFLTSKAGLGKWFTATMVDEVSLESWAEWCDQLVNDGKGGTHPRHQFDGVIDRGESGWDVLLNICRAGRCIPWLFANKVTFKFEHPDTSGFLRPVVMLFAESNIEDLRIYYKDRRSRPNIYDAQILDEDLEWEPNVISQEDPDAFGLNEPWKVGAEQVRRELVEFFGITRAAHARREVLWMHSVNRLSYSEVEFTVGVDAFPVEIGDVIALQHDVPRWFDTATGGFRTTRSGSSTTNVYLDHAVTLDGGHSYQVMIVRNDTTPQLVDITASAGTYAVDTAISVASAQTFNKGAVVAFGEVGKTVRKYQVIGLEFAEAMKFRVTAILYDDAAFTLETTTALGEDSTLASEGLSLEEAIPAIEAVQTLVIADGSRAVVSWVYPPERKGPARVYLRPKPEAIERQEMPVNWEPETAWSRVFEGEGTAAELGLEPGREYEVAVVLQTEGGGWGSPSTVVPAVVIPEEFSNIPPPVVARGRAEQTARGLELSWEPVRSDSLDYYEVRAGLDHWNGAAVLGRTAEPRFLVEDAPYAPGLDLPTQTYQVRARHLSGLYSPTALQLTHSHAAPFEYPTNLGLVHDLAPTALGALSDVEVAADGSLVLSAGKLSGTYMTPALEVTKDDVYFWSMRWTQWEEESLTVGEATLTVGSGESHWRTLDGREATFHQQGADFDFTVGDPEPKVGDGNYTVGGRLGSVGSHTRVKAEAAFWDPGAVAYGPWVTARSGPRGRTSKMKLRFTLTRRSEKYQPHVGPSILLAVFHAAPVVPVGTIAMWSGSPGAVPAGWELCDGDLGTPDLRERFILAHGATHPVGASGGVCG